MNFSGSEWLSTAGFKKWRHVLRKGAAAFHIELDDFHIERFYRHAGALLQWSQKTNLTAITDPQEVAVKHFVDSLAPISCMGPMQRVLDLGSGGGFPGLPLKIVCSDIDLTLLDAVRKKVSFVQHVIRLLELKNTRGVHARLENLGQDASIAAFDTVVCRAFSNLKFIITHSLPLLTETGQIVIWKGRVPQKEIIEVQPLLVRKEKPLSLSLLPYQLPIINAHRTIVLVNAGGNVPVGKS
jgi:16S rRNA (guanine527-N7)-methyltransferase